VTARGPGPGPDVFGAWSTAHNPCPMGVLWLVIPGVVAGLVAVVLALIGLARHQWLLVASLLGSVSALLLVTGWLLADPSVSKADALKTGGLAGGAILALYALWINDRRRRTEEARHDVDRDRAQRDRERVSDERFAKAVELLGNEADQVRLGALHVLAGVADSRPSYTQTVLDVLCSYLRRPFAHPSYQTRPDNPDQAAIEPDATWSADQIAVADRERQVRLTAHRLIADLLPGTDVTEPVRYDLDLTGANLEYLDLTGRQIGRLTARRAHLYGINRLSGVRIQRPALFSGAVFHGKTDFFSASFDGGLSLMGAQIGGVWRVPRATVRNFVDLRTAAPAEQIGALTIIDETTVTLGDDTSWAIQSEHSDRSGPAES
jgi:hypothetical protein